MISLCKPVHDCTFLRNIRWHAGLMHEGMRANQIAWRSGKPRLSMTIMTSTVQFYHRDVRLRLHHHRRRAPMPPEYADESFWDKRFTKERRFEWLGSGDPLLSHIRSHLEERKRASDNLPHLPLTLHIGAGTSLLSEGIIDLYEDLGFVGDVAVVNTDFAAEAVANAERAAVPVRSSGLRSEWTKVDALSWTHNLGVARRFGEGGDGTQTFDVVVDKSTSDAISCGHDLVFRRGAGGKDEHPAIASVVSAQGEVVLEPLRLLALHLAAIVRPEGIWVVLSYSADRFPFLRRGMAEESQPPPELDASRWWTVETVEEVEAPSGQQREGVHAPQVTHRAYVLRRTDVPV
jgi:hypothetical protein